MIRLQGAYGCILVLCDMCVGYGHYDDMDWIYYMCVVIGHACMQSLHIWELITPLGYYMCVDICVWPGLKY